MREILAVAAVEYNWEHGAGHNYHDVEVEVTRTAQGKWKVVILEMKGKRGTSEERCHKKVVARGLSLAAAAQEAERRAAKAGVLEEYLIQALSQAVDEAEETTECEEDNVLASATLEELQAEVKKRLASEESSNKFIALG